MSFLGMIKGIFDKKDEETLNSVIPNSVDIPNIESEPEVEIVKAGQEGFGSLRHVINFDNVSTNVKALILNYRDMALYPEIDSAIQEITNEAVVSDDNEAVTLEIENDDISDNIKESIIKEFDHIVSMMEFNSIGDEHFRQWYEDGRIYYHGVLDLKKIKDGIQNIKLLSPLNLKRIKEEEKYFYIYDDKISNTILKIPSDHITFASSGLTSPGKEMYISYIHKAVKPFNQLKMLEDSAVIYRITRAPERRVFYIDVGQMNKSKAESYMTSLMNKFRNRITYNSTTGEIDQQKNTMTMTEDFWLPSSEGGSGSRGTKIDTLPPGCLSMDTKVSLLDGRELSIKEIEDEMNEGNELWTYSCHPETGKILPGLISWAGVTQKSAKVMKITLDNGESIVCTPDHQFPVYDKGFLRADELEENESMIPLYRKNEFISKNKKLEYEQFFDNEDKKWKYTHRVVGKNLKDKVVNYTIHDKEYSNGLYDVLHHKDINRYNNSPLNLTYMSWHDHRKHHCDTSSENFKKWKLDKPEDYIIWCKNRSEETKRWWASLSIEEYINQCEKQSQGIKEHIYTLSEEDFQKRKIQSIKNRDVGAKRKIQKMKNDDHYLEWVCEQQSNGWTDDKRNHHSNYMQVENIRRQNDSEYMSYLRLIHTEKQKIDYHIEHIKFVIDLVKGKTTHQITSKDICKILNENDIMMEYLYDLNINKNVPNWSVEDGFSSTMLASLVKQFNYKGWSDFRRKESVFNHRIVKIEYLEDTIEVGTLTIDSEEIFHNYHTFALSVGIFTKNSNLGEMGDIEYFRKKLLKSLRVPYSRFDTEGGISSIGFGGMNGEMSRDEVRFTKFINKLRKKFGTVFFDLLKKQLLFKNIITAEEWLEWKPYFNLKWDTDSYFTEVKKSEILKNRVDLAESLTPYIGKYFSNEYVQREIFQLSEEEIKEETDKIAKEKKSGLYKSDEEE